MDSKPIGRRIKLAREAKKLTQEQLAEIVDLSPMHVSVLERGQKPPKLETMIKLANMLGVSGDYLLQDVITHSKVLPATEITLLISSLPENEQNRILQSIRAYVEAYSNETE